MAALTTPPKPKFSSLFRNLDSTSRFVFVSLGLASVSLFALATWTLANRFAKPQLILAAGDPTGESYIISEAIGKVAERKSNIKITVLPTDGTAENLQMLEQGKVQLATAQADVISEEMDVLAHSNTNLSNSLEKIIPQTVAILYKDLFQLVVRDPNIKQFGQLKGKVVALPAHGGQYQSFLKVAEHYGLLKANAKPSELTITGLKSKYYDDKQAEEDFQFQRADALFRVRAVGNQGVSASVKNYGGRLVGIEQAQAMKIEYPAFESVILPQGAYRGNPAVPEENLTTVAVSRLLVASDKVDESVIQEITRIIFEYRQEIANTISQQHPEVKPLVATISQPSNTNGTGIPPIHSGAIAFYERNKPSFVKENADILAFFLTVALLVFSWIRQLKLWIEQRRKSESDEYIESAIKLMNTSLGKLDVRQQQLDDIFRKAADALFTERISQESFRTFNEAYKTTREALEHEGHIAQKKIEQEQKALSCSYVNAVVELMQTHRQNKDLLQKELDKILQQVSADLIAQKISQSSFRTFIETYKAVR